MGIPDISGFRFFLIITGPVNIFGIDVATILIIMIVRITTHPLGRRWWWRRVLLREGHYSQGGAEDCQRHNPAIIMMRISMGIISGASRSGVGWRLTVVSGRLVPVSRRIVMITRENECGPE
jgi:hypothetical protein